MFNLDPGKLIVIAVVAIILLGPDKLPQVARQVGGAWRSFTDFRRRMEAEVRSSIPDLPATSEIARLARSPSALLQHLSTMSEDQEHTADGEDGTTAPGTGEQPVPDTGESGGAAALSNGTGTNGDGREGLQERPVPAPPVDPEETRLPASTPSPSTGTVVQGDPNLN